MLYALSFRVHGWPRSWRAVTGPGDLVAGEVLYEGNPSGKVWDDGLATLRNPTGGETAATAARERLRAQRTEAWVSPSLQNGWVDFGSTIQATGYRLEADRRVHLRGAVKNGSGSGAAVFTLPAGYRPTADRSFLFLRTGPGIPRVDVESGGAVRATDIGGYNGFLSLEGISFDIP